jgi:hypothetical protein
MVCGIFWPLCLTSVLAIIFGHQALGQIEDSHGWQRGRGQALAGLWLGYMGLASILISFVVTVARG